MKRLLTVMAILVSTATSVHAAAAPEIAVAPVIGTGTTATGQKIEMPKEPTVTVTVATLAPGSRLPTHKHMYPHYGYVLGGELTVVNEETGKSFAVKKGEFLVEMNDTWHYGENKGKEPVKLLLIDHLPKGVTSNMVLKNNR